MSNLIFYVLSLQNMFNQNRKLKNSFTETTHYDSCDVSSLGLVNTYHLFIQWQIHKHRQKEKLIHLCSTVLSALGKYSGIRVSELELLKSWTSTRRLSIFQVLTSTCLRGCRPSPSQAAHIHAAQEASSTPLLASLILNSLGTYNYPAHVTGSSRCLFLN